MIATKPNRTLDRLLDPVAQSLNTDSLRQLVELRAEPNLQRRLDLLADKCTEGQLTTEEREEYELYVHAIHVISILQAKARKMLAAQSQR